MLVKLHPNPGWDLLIGLLPKDPDVGSPRAYPRWRDWDAVADKPVIHGEWRQIVAAVWERTLQVAEERADRWHQIVANLSAFSPELRTRIRHLLEQFARQAGENPTRPLVREAIREFTAQHRQFPDADWSLHEEELHELEQTLAALEPEDPIERHKWLFASSWPKLAIREEFDYHQQQKAIEEAQDEAVRSTLSTGGTEAVLQLAQAATLPHDVGAAVGRVLQSENAQVELLRKVRLEFFEHSLRNYDLIR